MDGTCLAPSVATKNSVPKVVNATGNASASATSRIVNANVSFVVAGSTGGTLETSGRVNVHQSELQRGPRRGPRRARTGTNWPLPRLLQPQALETHGKTEMVNRAIHIPPVLPRVRLVGLTVRTATLHLRHLLNPTGMNATTGLTKGLGLKMNVHPCARPLASLGTAKVHAILLRVTLPEPVMVQAKSLDGTAAVTIVITVGIATTVTKNVASADVGESNVSLVALLYRIRYP